MRGSLWFWVPWLVVVPTAFGQEPPNRVTRLTVQPAAGPEPALKYKLIAPLEERSPGNAALHYYRSYSPDWQIHRGDRDFDKKLEEWRSMPVDRLPTKELAWLHNYGTLQEIDIGARRESCDWDMTRRLRKDGFSMLLPDMQSLRGMANLLTLRARLEMAEGRLDRATYTLQTGFGLAHDLREGPTLIIGLIGVAIGNLMAEEVETLIQRPNAPNLYWALTELPRPLVDFRKPLQGERIAMQAMLPSLKDLEARPLSPAELQEKLDRLVNVLRGLGEPPSPPRAESKLGMAFLVAKAYPRAKAYLIQHGRSSETIDALPTPQVVMIYSLIQLEHFTDDLFKWWNLPYWKAREGITRAEKALGSAKESLSEGIPLASLLLPAIRGVGFAQARLERRLAALRCIEAIRLYAAAHDGNLPQSLDTITEVPIPIDPVTGKAFRYSAKGATASLSATPVGTEQQPAERLQYEITIRK